MCFSTIFLFDENYSYNNKQTMDDDNIAVFAYGEKWFLFVVYLLLYQL